MYFPSKVLIVAVIIHGCVGSFEQIIVLLLAKAPVSLGKFFEESLLLHYGISLGNDGKAQAISIMNNIQMLGSIFSLFLFLPKMDTFGRKSLSIYFRASFGFAAATLMLFAWIFCSVELFAVGCIFLGAASPIRDGVTRHYLSECSPDNIRGFITQSISSVHGIIGLLYSAILMPQFLGNDENWHYTLYIAIMGVLIFVLGAVFIPESPKFLWFQGKKTQSIDAVKAFHGKDVDIDSVILEYELEKSMIHSKSATHLSIFEIWKDIGLRNSLKLVIAFAFITYFGPAEIYFLYSIILKNKFGFSNSQSVSLEFVLSMAFLPVNYLLPFLYEKIGRRPIFLFSVFLSLITSFLMFGAETVFELNNSAPNFATFAFAACFTVIMEIAMSLGLSTFGILLIADLLPAPAKAATTQAMMLTTSILGIIFNFLFSFFQPLLGFSLYLPIIGCQLFFFVYLFRNLPETKQKSVHQNFEQLRSRAISRRDSLLIKSRASTLKYGTL